MRTKLQAEELLMAIDDLCQHVKLCKISTVAELVGMDAAQLVEALAPAVSKIQVIVLGPTYPGGFLWLTHLGVLEARRLRRERGLAEPGAETDSTPAR